MLVVDIIMRVPQLTATGDNRRTWPPLLVDCRTIDGHTILSSSKGLYKRFACHL